jgi:hypothetical protein
MGRYRTTIAIGVILALVAAGLVVAAAAPEPAAGNSITVTAPAGSATYHNGELLTVSWKVATSVQTGYFCVYVMSAGGVAEQGITVTASRGITSYTTHLEIDSPLAAGYYVTVKYRSSKGADFSMSGDSPGTFTIVDLPVQFQTNAWGALLTVRKGDPVTFRFSVNHPAPAPGIAAGWVVLVNAKTGAEAARIDLMGKVAWVVSTEWIWDTWTMTYTWARCTLDPGSYRWWIDVTTTTGESDPAYMDGYLTVPRR